ncbi:MAG: hypothetical protein WCG80_15085 [Spirochaetales bacterium]
MKVPAGVKVSASTQTWQVWREQQTLRRRLLSWAVSLLLPALGVLAAWLAGSLLVLVLGDGGQALSVKLGSPDGEDTPLSVTSQADPVMNFLAQQAPSQTAVIEDLPDPTAIPVAKPEPVVPTPAPAPAKPVPKVVEKPTPKVVEKPASPSPLAPAPAAPTATTVVKGAENGNTAQAVFEGNLRGINEGLHPLISLFMPLPKVLDAGLLDRLQPDALNSVDDFRKMLLALYEPSGNQLRLKGQPPVVGRDYYWVVLLRAGYDTARADYKTDRNLKPVSLTFKLSAPAAGENPRLTDIKLTQSSGDLEIDEIVKTVFEQYRYSNPLGTTVPGKFTYEF